MEWGFISFISVVPELPAVGSWPWIDGYGDDSEGAFVNEDMWEFVVKLSVL